MHCLHEEQEEMPLTAHRYDKWVEKKRFDCTETGTRHRDCLDCDVHETGELKPRKHAYHRWEITQTATCSKQGHRVRNCKHCDHQEQQILPLRKHRPGRWQVQIKATLDKPGLQVKACKLCGEILLRRPYHPGKQHFAVDFCVEGVILTNLWPDVRKGWLSAVLVSLDQEGEQIYPLLAKGRDVVGEVLIKILNEEMTVTYKTFGQKTEVLKERMQIFLPGDTLTMDQLGSRRQGWKLNKPISIQRHLKDADVALVFLRMDGIYDPDDVRKEALAEHAKDAGVYQEMMDQISLLFKFH